MTLPADQRKEWIRSRRNRRKQARAARVRRQFLRYSLLIALLCLGYNAFNKLPWSIKDIEKDIIVSGNEFVTADQVRGVLANALGEKIFEVNPQLLEKQVVTLPAVKHAFVRRYALPHPRITVQVLEEFPWATYSPAPELPPQAVIAQSGRLIPISDFPRVPQPSLIIYGPPKLNLSRSDVSAWASAAGFITEQTGQDVQFIDMRKPTDVRVQNGDLYLKLGTPDTTLTRRLGRLSSVLSAIEPLKGRLEYVDLSLDNNIPLKVAKAVPGAKGNRTAAQGERAQQPQSAARTIASTSPVQQAADASRTAGGAGQTQQPQTAALPGTL